MRTSVLTVLAASSLFLAACEKKPSEPTGASNEAAKAADDVVDRYTVRGKVVALPAKGAAGEVQVHHEAIPTFKTATGETSGMMAMQMPFHAEAKPLKGLAPGDAIEVDFETHWDKRPPLRVRAIRKLPADTVLKLGQPSGIPKTNEKAPAPDHSQH